MSGLPCREDVIGEFNWLGEEIVGLGDVECPQRLERFRGILGDFDGVTAMKYLASKGLLVNRVGDLSSDFSTPYVMVHSPPWGVGTGIINGVQVGSREVRAKILTFRPKAVFHGHSEFQGVGQLGETRVVSVGLAELGFYVRYEGEGKFSFQRLPGSSKGSSWI